MQGENKGEGEVSRNSSAAAAGEGAGSGAAWKRPGLPHSSTQQPPAFAGTRAAAPAVAGLFEASGTG